MTTKDKVYDLLYSGKYSKIELAEELGISRPALDNKLGVRGKWKKLEVYWINKLYNKDN